MCAYQEVQIRAHSMARSKGIVNERVISANALAEHCRQESH
jgi:hypothetical protein